MAQISLSQWARKVGVSPERARQWARASRIAAVNTYGHLWLIDVNAKRPEPQKSGRKGKYAPKL